MTPSYDRRHRPALTFRGPHGIRLTVDGRLTALIVLVSLLIGFVAGGYVCLRALHG